MANLYRTRQGLDLTIDMSLLVAQALHLNESTLKELQLTLDVMSGLLPIITVKNATGSHLRNLHYTNLVVYMTDRFLLSSLSAWADSFAELDDTERPRMSIEDWLREQSIDTPSICRELKYYRATLQGDLDVVHGLLYPENYINKEDVK